MGNLFVAVLAFTGLIAGCDAGITEDRWRDFDQYVIDAVTPFVDPNGVRDKAIGMIVRVEADGYGKTFVFGSKKRGQNVPPTGSENWVIGSVSKVLLSFNLALKIVQGNVKLDSPLRTLLPSDWTVPTYSSKEIALVHLLTHTAGLPRYPKRLDDAIAQATELESLRKAWSDYTITDLKNDFSQTVLANEPGKAFAYSDFGFGLAQKVNDEVSRRPFPKDFALFAKGLSLSSTAAPEALESSQKNNLLGGYMPAFLETAFMVVPVFAGDGYLYSNAPDLGRILRVMARLEGSPTPSHADAIGLMEKTYYVKSTKDGLSIEQGLGLGILATDDDRVYKKNGVANGNTTAIIYDPKRKIALAFGGNVAGLRNAVNTPLAQIIAKMAETVGSPYSDNMVKSIETPF